MSKVLRVCHDDKSHPERQVAFLVGREESVLSEGRWQFATGLHQMVVTSMWCELTTRSYTLTPTRDSRVGSGCSPPTGATARCTPARYGRQNS